MRINGFVPSEKVFELNGDKQEGTKATSFSNILKDNLDKLNEKQVVADNMTNDFIAGKPVEVHELMLATEESKMSLQLAIQVRNKVVEAVQELNRMQL